MIEMDVAAVAAAVGGTLVDCPDTAAAVTGAVADSRLAAPGDLYVAIAGERVDGHDFAAAAIACRCCGHARFPSDRRADHRRG